MLCEAPQLWREWELSQASLEEVFSQEHAPKKPLASTDPPLSINKVIMALFNAGDPMRAWQLFKQFGEAGDENIWKTLEKADHALWTHLFNNAETMPRLDESLYRAVTKRFLLNLERQLSRIERKLGIRWVRPTKDVAYHVIDDNFQSWLAVLGEAADDEDEENLWGPSKVNEGLAKAQEEPS